MACNLGHVSERFMVVYRYILIGHTHVFGKTMATLRFIRLECEIQGLLTIVELGFGQIVTFIAAHDIRLLSI